MFDKEVKILKVDSSSDSYLLPSASRQPVQSLDKDAFLRLFVEQLKNQDPMSPQDSNAFMTQMAQFSMLEQLANLEKEISRLRRLQEMGEASALLGREVKVQTPDGSVFGRVEKVTFVDDGVQVFIEGNSYGLDQVTEVNGGVEN